MSSYDASDLSKITGAECHVAAYDKEIDIPSTSITQTPRSVRPLFPEGGFLVLAPTLSTPVSRTSSIESGTAAAPALSNAAESLPSAMDDSAPAVAAEQATKDRRSSSVSSAGGFQGRILKLGPVHHGEKVTSDYVHLDEE